MFNGLKQRGARWFLRRRVPAHYVEAWGSAEVTRALGTSDYRVARRLLPRVWADLDDEFTAKHAAIAPADPSAGCDANLAAAHLLVKLRAKREIAAALDASDARSGSVPHDNPTILELQELWLKQQEWPRSTIQGMGRAVARFNQVVGIRRIKAVTRQDLTVFTDKMREPGVVTPKGVSIPNMNTTLSLLSALFGFAKKRNLIETNPAQGSQLKDARRPREKRREFDGAALKAIFSSPIYTADERPEGGAGEAVYWLPLLALYTGARINELCQLHPDDVAQEGYTDRRGKAHKAWVIRVEHDRAKGKRVKTEGSERRIPVHPDLIKLGFVTYAQGQAGKPLLFDRLAPSAAEDKLSGNWGRWWGRHLRKACGVVDERMTFHSFRHTFKHHVRQSQIPKDVNDALTGHETGDAADAYGGLSFPLFPLVEGMKRYRVDGFTLPRPPPAYRAR